MTEPGVPDQVPMYPVTWPVANSEWWGISDNDWYGIANNNWVATGYSTSTTAITYNPVTTTNITYTGGTVGAPQNFIYPPDLSRSAAEASQRLNNLVHQANQMSRTQEGLNRAAQLAAGLITDAQAMEEFQRHEEERFARNREINRQREEDAQRYRAERRAAQDRAQNLLESHLTETQRRTYREASYFDVTVRSGRTWRICTDNGYSGNVKLLDDQNREVASYCCHSGADMPDADHFFVQLITLQCDEDLFIARGNMSGLVAGFRELVPDRDEATARVTIREIEQRDQDRSVARERWDQAQERVRRRRAPLPEENAVVEVEFDWEQDAV